MGIRFADPPIGQYRFRRPQYKRLEGDINATTYGQPCPQPDSAGFIVGSEDCLWLNVYTPRMPDESTGLPVIVWYILFNLFVFCSKSSRVSECILGFMEAAIDMAAPINIP